MANQYKGEVTINVGGNEKVLLYDMNALAELEDRFECDLDQLIEVFENSISIKKIRTFLWAGLIHENEDLTEKEVGSWIGKADTPIKAVIEKMGDALKLAMGVYDEVKNQQSPQKTGKSMKSKK